MPLPTRLRFLTSTPMNVLRGSGTFVGIATLAEALKNLGAEVEIVSPSFHLPNHTLQRLIFNQTLRFETPTPAAITIGFDMDGYTVAGKTDGIHVASIKGVIADEIQFESGLAKATMRIQAKREKLHVQRADFVLTTSRYSAFRIRELYELEETPRIVPELIDLKKWKELFQKQSEKPDTRAFTVLCVCRFYPRKRVKLLLKAAARLRSRIPGFRVEIVGGGPESGRLHQLCRDLNLESMVSFRENISAIELARQYKACDIFCLPSVQEGFGIVFLEAMAAGKPVVAANAAAMPEVVTHGILVEPDNEEGLAEGIENLYRSPTLRQQLGALGQQAVAQFDAPVVARSFLRELESFTQVKRRT